MSSRKVVAALRESDLCFNTTVADKQNFGHGLSPFAFIEKVYYIIADFSRHVAAKIPHSRPFENGCGDDSQFFIPG